MTEKNYTKAWKEGRKEGRNKGRWNMWKRRMKERSKEEHGEQGAGGARHEIRSNKWEQGRIEKKKGGRRGRKGRNQGGQ